MKKIKLNKILSSETTLKQSHEYLLEVYGAFFVFNGITIMSFFYFFNKFNDYEIPLYLISTIFILFIILSFVAYRDELLNYKNVFEKYKKLNEKDKVFSKYQKEYKDIPYIYDLSIMNDLYLHKKTNVIKRLYEFIDIEKSSESEFVMLNEFDNYQLVDNNDLNFDLYETFCATPYLYLDEQFNLYKSIHDIHEEKKLKEKLEKAKKIREANEKLIIESEMMKEKLKEKLKEPIKR